MANTHTSRTTIAPDQACPISPMVDIVFSRWTTPILWSLHHHGRQRFVELQHRIGSITSKVLTQRLRQMERDGLVRRTYHPEIPPRVEYNITELGSSLEPVFATLGHWWEAHAEKVELAREEFDNADR
ncbi:DNA-binding HxlR family transcriptional regulator [Lipingzhangella halophila]|uniref:DNA-binding HxlR family transcriptional regulator n=1 Tax=Lipingzhangella halophila TaxID=1783352 RepID=A0A7W7RM15_9ACTN|nr:helix-turn-helix domain-containing protein [Lipingzhangella halophila]MBB4934474.1 DNA-binding HxlR family transcriptional regulator [Lipingzhangella halophila]